MWPERAKTFLGTAAIVMLAACSKMSFTPAGTMQGATQAGSTRLSSPILSRHDVPLAALPEIRRLVHPPTPQRGARPFIGGVMYTAQYYGNDVKIYSVHQTDLKYVEQLTSGLVHPQGMATTPNLVSQGLSAALRVRVHPNWSSNGGWYIANTGASNIPIFISTPSGPQGPIATLQDPGQYPIDVAASVTHQFVVVSNAFSTSLGSGSLSIFPASASLPNSYLSVSDYVQGSGVAVDSKGNCYWSYDDLQNFSASIVEFPSCEGSAQTIVSGLGAAGGLAFDRSDNLYYVDQLAGVYKCTKTSSPCSLLSADFGDPVFLNFDKSWEDLWVSDAAGYIDAVDPQSGAIISSTPATSGRSDPPIGIAPAPAARY